MVFPHIQIFSSPASPLLSIASLLCYMYIYFNMDITSHNFYSIKYIYYMPYPSCSYVLSAILT